MPVDQSLIEQAERRGYLEFDRDRARITYLCGRRYADDFTDPEEVVRAFIYSWLVIERGYPADNIRIEFPVPRRVPGDRADIVVFRDEGFSQPYLVVEAKPESCTGRDWAQAIEQGFGNANSLRDTEYLLVDRGEDSLLFDIQNHPPTEREQNRLGSRESLAENFGLARQFRLTAGGPSDIYPVEPSLLEARVRRAHAAIWAGGRRDPFLAFDEWSKILFAKIWDERHTRNGEPRHFQKSASESISQASSRIRSRYIEARRGDPSIFADDEISLPDAKIVQVVQMIEEIGFTLCEIDALGAAFEHFFGSVFRGDLGQYFTRRELVRFIMGILQPKDTDFILDPTAGSGGFLLESLIQVWHSIDENYEGQPDAERRKIDFALNNIFGIEIHGTLGRVCKTNLLIHKDGHTNVEVERSCLDSTFTNPNLRWDSSVFTMVVGNPPFGDTVEEGDADRLGNGSLGDFQISRDLNQISSELVIIERALQFVVPGGRVGMVVPDGALNNPGEGSHCPRFRRFLLKNSVIEMVVSLPDFAFRKAGAQNKTSLIFLRKYTVDEKRELDASYGEYLQGIELDGEPSAEQEKEAIRHALSAIDYPVFLAEVDHIGYSPSGSPALRNELYSTIDTLRIDFGDISTVLGQYATFQRDPDNYIPTTAPSCQAMSIVEILDVHPSYRLDPKFHLFQLERIQEPPAHLTQHRLGDLLIRRDEQVQPQDTPDREFLTLTVHQDGSLSPREAGKGRNPPSWHGAYFTGGSRWFRAYEGDLIYSQIDLWKGCVAVIPPEFNDAIVTQEFPIYQVDRPQLDPRYLALLLRSKYFQRAIRAITTGHSNRRRTQQGDFEDLLIFLPDLEVQQAVADLLHRQSAELAQGEIEFGNLLDIFEEIMLGERDPSDLDDYFATIDGDPAADGQ